MTPFTYCQTKYTKRDKRALIYQIDAANSNERQRIMRQHRLSTEEFAGWKVRYNEFGLDGLKVKLRRKA